MTFKVSQKSSTTGRFVTSNAAKSARRDAVREQARREIPALRKQADEGISTLQRLAERASR